MELSQVNFAVNSDEMVNQINIMTTRFPETVISRKDFFFLYFIDLYTQMIFEIDKIGEFLTRIIGW